MPTYKAVILVHKCYHVSIDADSADEARELADKMTTMTLAEVGRCTNIDTECIEVEEDLPYDHDHPADGCKYLAFGLWDCGVTDQS